MSCFVHKDMVASNEHLDCSRQMGRPLAHTGMQICMWAIMLRQMTSRGKGLLEGSDSTTCGDI